MLREMSKYPSFTPKEGWNARYEEETDPSLPTLSPIHLVTAEPSPSSIAITPFASNVTLRDLPSRIPFCSLDEEESSWSQIDSHLSFMAEISTLVDLSFVESDWKPQ